MGITPYHTKYYVHELTKRCSSDSIEKLAGAVASAQVDLNPRQVEAALFPFNSPLSKGALLADGGGPYRTFLIVFLEFRGTEDRYPNFKIGTISKMMVSCREWGKDDYSLRVENLPKAPPPKGQMELLSAGEG